MQKARTAYLFHRYFKKTASPAEEQELFWLLHHEPEDEMLQQLMEEAYNDFEPSASPFPEGSREKMLAAIRQSAGVAALPVNRPTRRLWSRLAAAAAILVLLSAGYWAWDSSQRPPAVKQLAADTVVVPGRQSATLILGNGREIRLTDAANGQLASEAGVKISKTDNGEVVYEVEGGAAKGAPDQYNTLATTRGEQYQVKLPDGTKVWLNAASSLKYPVAFNGGRREVALEGEAYFEVAALTDGTERVPFVVRTKDQQVEVLGTHFNINSYADAAGSKTTLLEGAVRVQPMGQLLKPGEQLVLKDGRHTVLRVQAEDAIAWKNGYFMFNNESLEDIMLKVARWYDVDVQYERIPARKITFFGTVSRFSQIGEVLKRLEMTGEVKFTLKGRQLSVAAR